MSETATDDVAPRLSGPGRTLVDIVAIALTLGSIAWAADVYRRIGLVLYTEQFLAAMLGLALPLVYLTVPAVKGRGGRCPWYDMLAAAVAFGACVYVVIAYPQLANEIVYHPLDAMIVSPILLILIIEGLRRAVGWVLVILLMVFLAYAMWGHYIPGQLVGRSVDTGTLVINLALDPQALLGLPMNIATTLVIPFVFLGQLLFQSGGSAFFTRVSMAAMGKYRGGSAKIAVTASGLFGSISGSAVSNVVSTGVITIPLMRESGYTAEAAGGIEAVASTGGQMMPPIMGASAFVMAEFLEIPYTDVVIAALVPAILYYTALFFVADLEAARTNIRRIDPSLLPRFWSAFRAGWYFPLPFGVLVYALFGLNQRPETSALYAAVTLFACTVVIGYDGKRFGLSGLTAALRETGTACTEIILIVAAAGLVIGVLNLSGLGFALTDSLVKLAEGNLVLLLVMAAFICIILGMGMPTLGVYVLLATLVAPAIVKMGVDQMSAHLFVLYFGMMSMITPPVAIAAFAAASLTRANPMRTAMAACRFGWLAYVIPFLFVASPSLILKGDVGVVAFDVATAFLGVWLFSVGLMGYLSRPLGAVIRIGFLVAGLAVLAPSSLLPGGMAATAAGIALGVLLSVFEIAGGRREQAQAESGG